MTPNEGQVGTLYEDEQELSGEITEAATVAVLPVQEQAGTISGTELVGTLEE